MTYNKLVIRRLPPSMDEVEFLKQVGPLKDLDYFCFFEASPGLGRHSFSRAYINFLNKDDMQSFMQRFDNHIFFDKNGREYPAVVEQPLWHKSATSGPFYIKQTRSTNEHNETESSKESESTREATIEQDSDFLEFIEKLKSQKRKTQQSPIQTIENNLDELTNASTSRSPGRPTKVSTPLLEYINRTMKDARKSK